MIRLTNQIKIRPDGERQGIVVGNNTRHSRSLVSASGQRLEEIANVAGNAMFSGFTTGGTMNSRSMSYINGALAQYDTLLSGLVSEDEENCYRFYRDMYFYDTVAGSCVDLLSTLPFSEFTITGLDKEKIQTFQTSIERLSFKTLLPEISVEYLSMGKFLGSLVFKARDKVFTDMMPHKPENATILPSPFMSVDPVIRMSQSQEIRNFLSSDDKRFREIRSQMNQSFLRALYADEMILDPATTLFLPRKAFATDIKGTSFLKRLLPIYLLEKTLYRGTLIEAGRRQRSLLHVQMGETGEWEPTPEELQAGVTMFQQADLDPLGAIVATRNGVQAQELRQGGDFWKVTDVSDSLVPMKLRALGISEAFLCLSGDTLVHTSNGLKRIDSFGDYHSMHKDQSLPIDVQVKGKDGKMVRATQWHYRGKARTINVHTYGGYELKATPDHQVLVLGAELKTKWVKVKDLSIGDSLCLDLNLAQVTKKTSVLDLKAPQLVAAKLGLSEDEDLGYNSFTVNTPKVMTIELAYIIGMLLSEGYLDRGRCSVTNSDTGVIEHYSNCVEKVFGIRPTVEVRDKVGERLVINGCVGRSNKVTYRANCSRVRLTDILHKLGLQFSSEISTGGKKASLHKVVPWSVYEADTQSRYAFLAAYIDGDGRVVRRKDQIHITITSYSQRMLQGLQILLSDLGYYSKIVAKHLYVRSSHARELYLKVLPFLKEKSKCVEVPEHKPCSRTEGIPAAFIAQALAKRHLRREINVGEWFLNDKGKEVLIERFGQIASNPIGRIHEPKTGILVRDTYLSGKYQEFLAAVRIISSKLYHRIIKLFDTGYVFEPVVSLKKGRVRHLFDLSIEQKAEPAFVANGLVVHNSGETNFNSTDAALSVFVENLRSYRDTVTQKIFTYKVFPLIAVMNGFYKRDPDGKETASSDVEKQVRMRYLISDISKLELPQIHWAKALRPEADQAYLDVLRSLKEEGLPIPLSIWAAAGGVTLERIIKAHEEEKELIAKLDTYRPHQEEGGDAAFASHADPLARVLSRDYGELNEVYGKTKTGKRRYRYDQRNARDQAEVALAAALERLSDPNHYASTVKKARAKGLMRRIF